MTVCLSLHLEGLVRSQNILTSSRNTKIYIFKNDPNLMIGSIDQGSILGLFNDSMNLFTQSSQDVKFCL